MFILAIMMRLLLTIIKTDFQHDYNTGLDEAGFLYFITNENNDNKHYIDDKKLIIVSIIIKKKQLSIYYVVKNR